MALPATTTDIAAPGPADGVVDGHSPVADLHDLGGTVGPGCTGEDRRTDHRRILFARVVVGNHHQISQFSGDLTHCCPFARIRLPPA